jgi:hypothetical protein
VVFHGSPELGREYLAALDNEYGTSYCDLSPHCGGLYQDAEPSQHTQASSTVTSSYFDAVSKLLVHLSDQSEAGELEG